MKIVRGMGRTYLESELTRNDDLTGVYVCVSKSFRLVRNCILSVCGFHYQTEYVDT